MNAKIAAVLTASLAMFSPLLAQIQWEHKDQTITLGVNQPHTKIIFPFTNIGGEPLGILSVVPSCGCLQLSAIEKEYQPGEAGVLEVQYVRTNETGPVNYKITVHTTDQQNPTVDLMVRIASTSDYVITPPTLHWMMGAQVKIKGTLFKDVKNLGLIPTSAFSTNANFTVEIKPVNPDGTYPIIITALSTEEATAGFIYVDVTAPDGTVEKTRIIAAVRDPNSSKIIVR